MIDVSKLKPFEIKLKDDEKPNFTNWNYCNDISDDGYSQVLMFNRCDNASHVYE